jgi:hypothetical protein
LKVYFKVKNQKYGLIIQFWEASEAEKTKIVTALQFFGQRLKPPKLYFNEQKAPILDS